MRKLTKIAAAVGSVLLVTYGTAAQANIVGYTPSAYAESELIVTSFLLTEATTGAPLGGLVGTQILDLRANVFSSLSDTINGAGPLPLDTNINPLQVTPVPSISDQLSAGPDSTSYVPYQSFVRTATGTMDVGKTYAGSASDHSGNGLLLNGQPSTTAKTQAQVNLSASSTGSANSRQTLGTDFEFAVTSPGTGLLVDLTFNAEAFMRVALGQPGVSAFATRSWGVTLGPQNDPLAANLLKWDPDGTVGTGLSGTCFPAGCSELADAFTLNQQATLQTTGDSELINPLGAFGIRVFIPNGLYTLSLRHVTNSDASVQVPEPGSLALLGLGLFGLAGMRRRFMKV